MQSWIYCAVRCNAIWTRRTTRRSCRKISVSFSRTATARQIEDVANCVALFFGRRRRRLTAVIAANATYDAGAMRLILIGCELCYAAHGKAPCRASSACTACIVLLIMPLLTWSSLFSPDPRPRPIDRPPTHPHPLLHVAWVPQACSPDCSFITDTDVFAWTFSYKSSDIRQLRSRFSVDAVRSESIEVDREWPQ